MPKYNADEQKSLFEPIEITIEGKDYKIEKVTEEMLNQVKAITKKTKEALACGNADEIEFDLLARQLCIFIPAKPEDFKAVDVRKLIGVINFLTESIYSQVGGKEKNV